MARFRVTVRSYKNAERPHFNFIVNRYHPTKGRKRSFHRTEEEARAAADALRIEVENFGLQALNLTAGQRIEALDAFERIKPFGATLTEVVRDFVERKQSSTATMSEVVSMYLRSRERLGRSVRHLGGLRNVLGRFNETFGARRIADITTDQIQEWLFDQGVAPLTSNHHRAMLHGVFQFALMRKIVRENPTKLIELRVVRPGKVGILAPAQMRTLLSHGAGMITAGGEADVLVTILLGGFAGLRPEEIARLKWSAIDLDHGQIDCGSEITKTAQHRYVKIEPVLDTWLRAIYGGFDTGRIQRDNFRRRWDAARRAAGFKVRGVFVLQPGPEGEETASAADLAAFNAKLVDWPHDALRHSYASYHLAKFQNAAVLALQMGHETTKMVFKNYRERVKAADAEAWWQLLPEEKS